MEKKQKHLTSYFGFTSESIGKKYCVPDSQIDKLLMAIDINVETKSKDGSVSVETNDSDEKFIFKSNQQTQAQKQTPEPASMQRVSSR